MPRQGTGRLEPLCSSKFLLSGDSVPNEFRRPFLQRKTTHTKALIVKTESARDRWRERERARDRCRARQRGIEIKEARETERAIGREIDRERGRARRKGEPEQ